MTKLIISKDETRTMSIYEVLDEYRPVAYKLFKKYMQNANITEDDIQELDVAIFTAFQSYDETHCFSTHLAWKIRGYITIRTRAFSKSIHGQGFEIKDLDFVVEEGTTLHSLIGDESIDIELDFEQKELIKYIESRMNPIELNILDVYLGKTSISDLAIKMNTNPQNISNISARLKKKMYRIMKGYYRNEFNIA